MRIATLSVVNLLQPCVRDKLAQATKTELPGEYAFRATSQCLPGSNNRLANFHRVISNDQKTSYSRATVGP